MTAITMNAHAASATYDPHKIDHPDHVIATATEGFNFLSNLNPDDCDNLDPSLFANVTPEDLDTWLQDSLQEVKGNDANTSRVTEVGRRLSLCLNAEIERRQSLVLGGEKGHSTAKRRGSNFSEFNFDSSTLPHDDDLSFYESAMVDKHLQELSHIPQTATAASALPQQQESSYSTDTRPSKRRRIDASLSSDDQLLNGLFAAVSSSSQSYANLITASGKANVPSSFLPQHATSSSYGNNMSSLPLPSSSAAPALSSVTCPSTGASVHGSPILEALRRKANQGNDDKAKKSPKSCAATPVVPLLSVISGLVSCMDQSEKSEQEIHDWDRNMGLRRSHSKTMRASSRSRKKLQQLQKQLWHGDIRQCRAKGA